jgi:hypothetical protein
VRARVAPVAVVLGARTSGRAFAHV